MAGLDPAIPLSEARPCHVIGIAESSPAMTDESTFAVILNTSYRSEPGYGSPDLCIKRASLPIRSMRMSMSG
jgi:hypothetical protein